MFCNHCGASVSSRETSWCMNCGSPIPYSSLHSKQPKKDRSEIHKETDLYFDAFPLIVTASRLAALTFGTLWLIDIWLEFNGLQLGEQQVSILANSSFVGSLIQTTELGSMVKNSVDMNIAAEKRNLAGQFLLDMILLSFGLFAGLLDERLSIKSFAKGSHKAMAKRSYGTETNRTVREQDFNRAPYVQNPLTDNDRYIQVEVDIYSDPPHRKRYDLRRPLVVGRTPSSDIFISGDPLVSKQHAVIYQDGGYACINDMGSKNGTYVNGARISGRFTILSACDIVVGTTLVRIQPISSNYQLR